MKTKPINRPRSPLRALVVTLVVAAITLTGIAIINTIQTSNKQAEAARQVQLQQEADKKAQKDAEDQKIQANYDLCIKLSNDYNTEAVKNIPAWMSTSEYIQQVQVIQNTTESFKNDCDRHYGESR